MFVLIEHKAGVDFVGHEDEIVPFAETRQLHKFVARPDASGGIVRAA